VKRFSYLIVMFLFSPSLTIVRGGGMEVIGPDTVDFGKYPAREKQVANFKIRNSGRETVRILKIYKTCGCATAICDKTELKAGEKANVEIVILPNSIFGTYSKPTYIENTDINNQFLSMTVKGTAVPLVEIKPQDFLYVGRIDTNRQWLQSFDITATEPGVKLGELNVKCNYPVETALNLLSAKDPAHYKLDMKLLPSAISGDFQWQLRYHRLTIFRLPRGQVLTSASKDMDTLTKKTANT